MTEQQKPKTIAELKADKIASLQAKFNSKSMRERLLHIAKGDENLVVANLNSFFTILTNDEGTGKDPDKKFLIFATTSSLALCFMESMQIGIPIDRRGLVHIVVYGMQAELEIDYRGFIYYLSKHYDDADFDIKLVFEGDTFNHWSSNGDDQYEYKKDPARTRNDYTKVTWAFMFMTYTKNGRERSKIEVMDKVELDKVKSKAKTQKVWDEWLGEMYKKAVCRRGCKLPLAAVDENAIEDIDNKNFELDRPDTANRLITLMQTQEEILNEKRPEPKKDNPDPAGNNGIPKEGVSGGDASNAPDSDTKKNPPVIDGTAHTLPADAGGADPAAPKDDSARAEPDPVGSEGLDGNNAPVPDPAPVEGVTEAPQPASSWDGKTLIISGKAQVKDFESELSALAYLKKVMSSRRHKDSRKKLIEENPLFMAALIKSGNGSSIAELHKIADAGV